MRPADVFIGHQFLDQSASPQTVWRRAEHGDQMGMSPQSGAHLFCFCQVHRHSSLTEHMFSRLKRRNRNRGVQVRWRLDLDDISVRFSEQFGPIGVRLRLWENLGTNL